VLTEKAVLEQSRMTQSVIQRWLCAMIDAGWEFSFSEGYLFRHADEHTVMINKDDAYFLCFVYWKTLQIPTPYDYLAIITGGTIPQP